MGEIFQYLTQSVAGYFSNGTAPPAFECIADHQEHNKNGAVYSNFYGFSTSNRPTRGVMQWS